MKPLKIITLFVVLAFLAAFANADDDDGVIYTNWHFNDLQLGAVGSIQQGGVRMGAMGRYLPEYQFDRHAEDHFWSAGVDLGITVFSKSDEPAFVVGEYGGYGAYHLDPNWDFRLFAGAQTWADYNGTAPFVGPDIIYHFASQFQYFGVDGIFISYKPVFHSKLVNFMSAGINFKF